MSTQMIQTPSTFGTSVTEQDIARGIAAGRRLRSLAVHAAIRETAATVTKPVVSLLAAVKRAPHGGSRATHAAA